MELCWTRFRARKVLNASTCGMWAPGPVARGSPLGLEQYSQMQSDAEVQKLRGDFYANELVKRRCDCGKPSVLKVRSGFTNKLHVLELITFAVTQPCARLVTLIMDLSHGTREVGVVQFARASLTMS